MMVGSGRKFRWDTRHHEKFDQMTFGMTSTRTWVRVLPRRRHTIRYSFSTLYIQCPVREVLTCQILLLSYVFISSDLGVLHVIGAPSLVGAPIRCNFPQGFYLCSGGHIWT